MRPGATPNGWVPRRASATLRPARRPHTAGAPNLPRGETGMALASRIGDAGAGHRAVRRHGAGVAVGEEGRRVGAPGGGARLRLRHDTGSRARSLPAVGHRRRAHREDRPRHQRRHRLSAQPDGDGTDRVGPAGPFGRSLSPGPRHPGQAPMWCGVTRPTGRARPARGCATTCRA